MNTKMLRVDNGRMVMMYKRDNAKWITEGIMDYDDEIMGLDDMYSEISGTYGSDWYDDWFGDWFGDDEVFLC